MDCLLDPYLIALPGEEAESVRFEEYLEELYNWTTEVRRKNHKFWLSWWIFDAMEKTKQYPSWNNVQIIKKQHPPVVTAYDVFRACERELLEPHFIDEVCKNEDLYYELANALVLPIEIEERLLPSVAQALRQTFVYLGIAKQIHKEPLVMSLMFASIPGKAGDNVVTLKIKANNISKEEFDIDIDAEWPLITDPGQLDDFLGLATIWENTDRAVRWAYNYLRAIGSIKSENIPCPEVKVGEAFNESIKNAHYENQPKVLAAIFISLVKAITGIYPRAEKDPHAPHHALRTGPQRTAPQIERESDQAKAWRVWVNGDGVRLHYWLLSNGEVEVSKVGVHDDVDID